MKLGGRFEIKQEMLDKIKIRKWHLLIKQDHKPLQLKSGLYVSDYGIYSSKSSMNTEGRKWMPTGVVTHMGADCRTEINIGDRVYFGGLRGIQQIDCNGELYHLMKEIDIMAIVNKDGDYCK